MDNKCKSNCDCNFSDKKILIIEKSYITRAALIIKLSNLGFSTLSLDNPKECLKLTKEIKPDLILISTTLEKKKGLETLKKLKSKSETKIIPVIVLAEEDDKNLKEEYLEKGASDFCIKTSLSLNELIRKVNNLISK